MDNVENLGKILVLWRDFSVVDKTLSISAVGLLYVDVAKDWWYVMQRVCLYLRTQHSALGPYLDRHAQWINSLEMVFANRLFLLKRFFLVSLNLSSRLVKQNIKLPFELVLVDEIFHLMTWLQDRRRAK